MSCTTSQIEPAMLLWGIGVLSGVPEAPELQGIFRWLSSTCPPNLVKTGLCGSKLQISKEGAPEKCFLSCRFRSLQTGPVSATGVKVMVYCPRISPPPPALQVMCGLGDLSYNPPKTVLPGKCFLIKWCQLWALGYRMDRMGPRW